MDEPTTGFDPAARRGAWGVIRRFRELGKTIFLTTHYMDEAQELADRVAIIAEGRIVAGGRPGELGAARAVARVRFRIPAGLRAEELPTLGDGVEIDGDRVEIRTVRPLAVAADLHEWTVARGIELPNVEIRRTSLEDVYLELTGEQ